MNINNVWQSKPITLVQDGNLEWPFLTLATALSKPIAVIPLFVSLLVGVGYLADIEAFYRPMADGPATHPLTVLLAMLLSFAGVLGDSGVWQRIKMLLALTALTVALCVLVDHFMAGEQRHHLTFFSAIVSRDQLAGRSNDIGINTALLMMLLAVSQCLQSYGYLRGAQLIAFTALFLPVVSLVGYAYKLENFYGQMSFYTSTIGLVLGFSSLLGTSSVGGMRALLAPYVGGRLARNQIVLGVIAPVGLGFFLLASSSQAELSAFGFYVVAIVWLIILMVVVSAIVNELSDQQCRESEAALVLAATTDQLTGLYNRAKFIATAEEEIDRGRREGFDVCLLLIDVDDFKKINDIAGYAIGDKALQTLAATIKASVRPVAMVARFEGEAFAVLLVNTPKDEIANVAESIRRNVQAEVIEAWSEQHGAVTVSIGGVSSSKAHTLDDMLISADTALYEAKTSGKNQIVLIGTAVTADASVTG